MLRQTERMVCMSGEELLRNAVVMQSVQDWRDAVKRLRKKPDNDQAEKIRRECEHFFRSGWFLFWTEIDGKKLLTQLERECGHDC